MIETDYYILPEEIHKQVIIEASELGLSIDYFLMEFCDIKEHQSH
jgi:hypothetical protein